MTPLTSLTPVSWSEPGCAVVRLAGDVDHASVRYWKAVLEAVAPGARIALDLAEVRYFDSAGVALLLWQRRRATGAGGQLALAAAPAALARILRVAGIPALIPCHPDLPAALAALRAAAA